MLGDKKKIIGIFLLILFTGTASIAKEYHVSKKGNDKNAGTLRRPFLSINGAIKYAQAGDTITAHAGIYREWVNPVRGGTSDAKRILYRAAPGEKVEIKGSEVIQGWHKLKDGVWVVKLPNTFFRGYNPYRDSINGDWFLNQGRIHHTGEVFLNGKSLFEKETIDKVYHPIAQKGAKDALGSTYTWYCENNTDSTNIWANFHEDDPNRSLTEISCRRTCIYPDKQGINYITIRGFKISQAATQWGAPTAEQVGMIAANWNKGWIIENNIISDSKCSGITLGKERSTGQNTWSADKGNVNPDGNIAYLEVIFNVTRHNWTKESIGGHIVRNNTIYNCEQTGICGSMGAIGSTIENNNIYNIWTKKQFGGYEIAAIKFHAPIDVTIRHNCIHNSAKAIWLDWMTQGTRISQNLFYNNEQYDLYLEVNHGPYMVDNNLFLSPTGIIDRSEGGAYIHNLFTGTFTVSNDLKRFTPYFLPHSTQIAGLATVFGGDDRVYNNIFIQPNEKDVIPKALYGTSGFNSAKLPAWFGGNVYYNGAKAADKEVIDTNNSFSENPYLKLIEENGSVYLSFDADKFHNSKAEIIMTARLGKSKIAKAAFDNSDGTPLIFDVDYWGSKRTNTNNVAGPFLQSNKASGKIKVW